MQLKKNGEKRKIIFPGDFFLSITLVRVLSITFVNIDLRVNAS